MASRLFTSESVTEGHLDLPWERTNRTDAIKHAAIG
jgi:S-adenosylmethionine synthetase